MSSFYLYILVFFLSNVFLVYKFCRCLAKYSSILFLFMLSYGFIVHVFRCFVHIIRMFTDRILEHNFFSFFHLVFWQLTCFINKSAYLEKLSEYNCFITSKTLYIKELGIRMKIIYFLEKLDPFIFRPFFFYFSSCQWFKTILCYHTEETNMDIFALFLKFRSKCCFYQFHVS